MKNFTQITTYMKNKRLIAVFFVGILIASFGMLSKDGLVIILGIVVGCIGVAISIVAVFLGLEFITTLKNFF
jgi:hypothetical protein